MRKGLVCQSAVTKVERGPLGFSLRLYICVCVCVRAKLQTNLLHLLCQSQRCCRQICNKVSKLYLQCGTVFNSLHTSRVCVCASERERERVRERVRERERERERACISNVLTACQ